jgi:spermidine/putrescine transport system ATP-binding protein
MAGLEIGALSVRYGSFVALHGIDLAFASSTYVVLLGPSGSGKTTLLSALGGFLQPTGGRVLLDGEDITALPPARRPTATVFQDYALFPHMTVGGNVAFGLRMHGVERAGRERQVAEMLALVGLEGLERRRIDQLSGGQRQRVALARALVIRPKVLLLDEPLGALDMSLRWRMQEELRQLQQRTGAIFVHVTHDQEEAMNLGDMVVVMRGGRIEDAGPPRRVYLRPATEFTATFMGESNLIDGHAVARDGSRTIVETALGRMSCEGEDPAPGEPCRVSIRPEHLRLASGNGAQHLGRGIVKSAVFQGPLVRCTVTRTDNPGSELIVTGQAETRITVGDEVDLYADPRHAVLLANPEQRQ